MYVIKRGVTYFETVQEILSEIDIRQRCMAKWLGI